MQSTIDVIKLTLAIMIYIGGRLLRRGLGLYGSIASGDVPLGRLTNSSHVRIMFACSADVDQLVALSGVVCIVAAFLAIWDLQKNHAKGHGAHTCLAVACGIITFLSLASIPPFARLVSTTTDADLAGADVARRVQVASLSITRVWVIGCFACLSAGLEMSFENTPKKAQRVVCWFGSLSVEGLMALAVGLVILVYQFFALVHTTPPSGAAFGVDVGNILAILGASIAIARNARVGAVIGFQGLLLDALMRLYVEGFVFFRFFTSWSIVATIIGPLPLVLCAPKVQQDSTMSQEAIGARQERAYLAAHICQAFRGIAVFLAIGFTALAVIYDGSISLVSSTTHTTNELAWGPSGYERTRRDLITSATGHYVPAILWTALQQQSGVAQLRRMIRQRQDGAEHPYVVSAVLTAAALSVSAVLSDILTTPDAAVEPVASSSMRTSSTVAIVLVCLPSLWPDTHFLGTLQLTVASSILVVCAATGSIVAPPMVRVAEASGVLIALTAVFASRVLTLDRQPKSASPPNSDRRMPLWISQTLCWYGVLLLLGLAWLAYVLANDGIPQEYGLDGGGEPSSSLIASVVIFGLAGVVPPFVLLR